MKAVQNRFVVFYVSQDDLKISGHSIHQRGLQDSCASWIAERDTARLLVL